MRYYLPTIRSDKEGFTQLAKLKDVLSHSFDDELIIDFSSCTFFDANMAASLKAVLAIVADSSKKVAINGLSQAIKNILRGCEIIDYAVCNILKNKVTKLPIRDFFTTSQVIF